MANNSINIPASLKIQAQIPLNYKEWVQDEDTLSYLGVEDNLAFTYHEYIEIFCKNEKTLYRWREVEDGEENTGLIPLDFTYPPSLIVDGINYSNRTFNFFKIEYFTSDNLIFLNVGNGEKIYKEGTKYQFKTISSTSLNITSTPTEINIELVDDNGIPEFIVNSDYNGVEELGTIQKPFKNLQNALNAYKGNGTNLVPQNVGVTIKVQKDTNIFTGSLAYHRLNLLIKQGAGLTCNPSFGQYVLDLDSTATLPTGLTPFSDTTPTNITIIIEENAGIILQKQGFNNSGTLLNTNSSVGKIINLLGKGYITILDDTNITNPSSRSIINANIANNTGFYNDGNVANFNIQCNLITNNTRLVNAGLNSKIYFTDSTTQYNDTIVSYNELTKPFELNNATLIGFNCNFTNYNKPSFLLETMFTLHGNSTFSLRNSNVGSTCNYLFENVGIGQPNLFLNNCFNDGIISTSIVKSSSVLWDNSTFINCYFYSGSFDKNEFKLKPNYINNIGSKIIATLQIYDTKSDAVLDGLIEGSLFRKRTVVNAVDLIANVEYQVATSGSPSLGAVGSFFTATGSETGTGTAYLDEINII